MRYFLIFLFIFLPLVPGAQERGVSRSVELDLKDSSSVQHALLIGNNTYRHWSPLKTAIRDVEGLRRVLLKRYGYEDQHVILLRDASRRQMLQGFDRLRERSKPDDKVLVYYAGHGIFDEKQDGYWVPVDGELENDYDYISNADVLNRLGAIEARHKLLVSDSCFGGSLLTRGMRLPDPSELRKPAFYLEKNRLKSVQGFSSGGNEPVYDGGPKWGGNSVFAYHLIARLEANQQQFLSVSELGLNVARMVSNDTQKMMDAPQTPIVQPIRNQGDQGGEFFFMMPRRRSLSVLSLFSPPSKGILNQRSEAAYRVIESKMMEMGRGIQGLNWKQDTLDRKISLDGLSKKMQQENLDAILFWTLEGRLEEEPSLLWQGMAYLDLYFWLYTLDSGRAVQRDRFVLTGERLPVEALDLSDSELRAQFRDVAGKLVQHWEENGAARFVRSVLE